MQLRYIIICHVMLFASTVPATAQQPPNQLPETHGSSLLPRAHGPSTEPRRTLIRVTTIFPVDGRVEQSSSRRQPTPAVRQSKRNASHVSLDDEQEGETGPFNSTRRWETTDLDENSQDHGSNETGNPPELEAVNDICISTPALSVQATGPTHVNVDEKVNYLLTVRNRGRDSAEQIQLRVALPDTIRLRHATTQPRHNSSGALVFDIGDLAAQAERKIQMVLIPTQTGPFKLQASVTFSTSLRATIHVQQPKLQLSCAPDPDVAIGQRFSVKLTVTNNGDGVAEDILIHARLPEAWNAQQSHLTTRVGWLSPGESRVVTMQLKALRAGQHELRFQVVDGSGNQLKRVARVMVREPVLDVQVLGPAVTFLHRENVYELHVKNVGHAPIRDVDIACILPRGLQVTVLGSPAKFDRQKNSLHTRIDELPGQVTDIIRFKAKAIQEGDQTQKLIARSPQGVVANRQLTTKVLSRANLQLAVVNRQGATETSAVSTIEIVLVNVGTRAAENVIVSVVLPERVRPLKSSRYTVENHVILFSARTIRSGEKLTLPLEVTSDVAGDHRVRVSVRSQSLTRPIAAEGEAFFFDSRQALEERLQPTPAPDSADFGLFVP